MIRCDNQEFIGKIKSKPAITLFKTEMFKFQLRKELFNAN